MSSNSGLMSFLGSPVLGIAANYSDSIDTKVYLITTNSQPENYT